MPKKKKLVHRGIYYESRTTIADAVGKREKAFADAWIEENKLRRHFTMVQFSCSKLEALMIRDDHLIPVSQDTATAVATIVQWLGSPIGFAFLEQTLKKAGYRVAPIKKEK